jgi:hypothetical protein
MACADDVLAPPQYLAGMTDEPRPGVSEPILYIDHSDIHENRLEDLKKGFVDPSMSSKDSSPNSFPMPSTSTSRQPR